MIVKPIKRLSGEITLPGDKSISHRAIMLGAIANGTTRVKGILDCDDCNRTAKAFRDMGIVIAKDGDETIIGGKGLNGLKKPEGPLDAGESGTTMRILAGILAGQDFEVIINGDASIQKRPMGRIANPLRLMGASIEGRVINDEIFAPLLVSAAVVRHGLAGGLSVPLLLAIGTASWVWLLPETRGIELPTLADREPVIERTGTD